MGSFSLFMAYAAINHDFALAAKELLLSTRILPPMSLLAGIVLIYIGGWLKKKKYTTTFYRSLMIIGVVFIALSVAAYSGSFVSYNFPLNPIFVGIAAIVLLFEALFVWKFSTRGGRKALV